MFFIFSGFAEKKKTQIEKIELVSNPQTFPGEKKYDTFGRTIVIMIFWKKNIKK